MQWCVIRYTRESRVALSRLDADVLRNMLMHQVLLGVMFWSSAPLFSFGIISGVLAVKIPIEASVLFLCTQQYLFYV
jgi:hypothetical protein